MAGDLNLKKSWHPGLLKNQEAVWKREKEALEERKKIAERQKEIQQERERDELLAMQEAATGRKRVKRLEWMYSEANGGTMGSADDKEEYLLGRKRIDDSIITGGKKEESDRLRRNESEDRFSRNGQSSSDGIITNSKDLVTKIREDPMLQIKRIELERAVAKLKDERMKSDQYRSSRDKPAGRSRSGDRRDNRAKTDRRDRDDRGENRRDRLSDRDDRWRDNRSRRELSADVDRPTSTKASDDDDKYRYRSSRSYHRHYYPEESSHRSSRRDDYSQESSYRSSRREYPNESFRRGSSHREDSPPSSSYRSSHQRSNPAQSSYRDSSEKDSPDERSGGRPSSLEREKRLTAMMEDAQKHEISREERLKASRQQDEKEREENDKLRSKSADLYSGEGEFIRVAGKNLLDGPADALRRGRMAT